MAASSASAEAIARLQRERKDWRKDRPPNFVAKPQTLADGSSNLFAWDIKIPAKPSSIWAPGRYAATMTFKPDYPLSRAECSSAKRAAAMFHSKEA